MAGRQQVGLALDNTRLVGVGPYTEGESETIELHGSGTTYLVALNFLREHALFSDHSC